MGEMFGMDPVLVLDEPDRRKYAIRVAALIAVQNARAKAEAEAPRQ